MSVDEYDYLTGSAQGDTIEYDAAFLAVGTMVRLNPGETAPIAAFKTRGSNGKIVWYGNILGQSPSSELLWVAKIPEYQLSAYPTNVGERLHVLHDTWDPNDRFCTVSASSLIALGKEAIVSRMRRDKLTQCFYNGSSKRWETMPTPPSMPTSMPTPTSTSTSTPTAAIPAPTAAPTDMSENGKFPRAIVPHRPSPSLTPLTVPHTLTHPPTPPTAAHHTTNAQPHVRPQRPMKMVKNFFYRAIVLCPSKCFFFSLVTVVHSTVVSTASTSTASSNPVLFDTNSVLENYKSKNVVRYVVKKNKRTRWYVKLSGFDQDEEINRGKCWVVQCNADMEPKSGMFKVNVTQLKAVQKR